MARFLKRAAEDSKAQNAAEEIPWAQTEEEQPLSGPQIRQLVDGRLRATPEQIVHTLEIRNAGTREGQLIRAWLEFNKYALLVEIRDELRAARGPVTA